MDSPFEKLGTDERQEWRELPATQAFIEELAGERTSVANQVLDAVKAAERNTEALAQLGGQLTALDNVALIIRRGK